ncbi:hypothetical protein [Streptomyces sp. NPDC006463]|uniref:hypothetical protein n=1 Tax=Streptomyces sp. NPDC006463 TaxID=3364746 RepID=UPI003676ECDA
MAFRDLRGLHNPASWYNTKIAGATGGDEDPFVEGPKLTVNGVPETVKAGGDWTNLSVHVDNSGKDALDGFNVGLVLARPDWVPMKGSQIKAEVLSKDKNGNAGWHDAEIRSEEEGVFLGVDLAGGRSRPARAWPWPWAPPWSRAPVAAAAPPPGPTPRPHDGAHRERSPCGPPVL